MQGLAETIFYQIEFEMRCVLFKIVVFHTFTAMQRRDGKMCPVETLGRQLIAACEWVPDYFLIPIRHVGRTLKAQDNLCQFDIFSASRPDF